MTKTIAEQLNYIVPYGSPLVIKDSNGNTIYNEHSNGYWKKYEYDSLGNETLHVNSVGYWYKFEYDSNGNEIYFENSNGIIRDNRKKAEYTIKEIADKLGVSVDQLRIKK